MVEELKVKDIRQPVWAGASLDTSIVEDASMDNKES